MTRTQALMIMVALLVAACAVTKTYTWENPAHHDVLQAKKDWQECQVYAAQMAKYREKTGGKTDFATWLVQGSYVANVNAGAKER